MKIEEKKEKCFKRAEVELLSVIQWMEQCRKEHEIEKLLENSADINMIFDAVANLQANMKKLEIMFTSLFMLSKTYNKQFASYLGRDRISKVMEYFENLKNTVAELKKAMPQLKNIPIEIPNIEDTYDVHYSLEQIIIIDEPECSVYPEDIFERNTLFTVIGNIEDYTKRQIVDGLLATFCKFYKVVLAIFMMCKNIIQEEQDNLNSQERLEAIYQKSLEEVWDSLKGIAPMHEEDYKEEMAEAKRFAMDRSLLQENFHQWSPEHFKRHAVAVQLYAQQMEKKKCNTLLLFPDNPEKELDAIKIAENLDYIIDKTKKSKDGRSFHTRRLVLLMEAIGYKGGITHFLRFIGEHYAGKNGFPGISSFSKNSKEMIELEANMNTAEGREKWEKCQEVAREVKSRVKMLLNNTNSVSLKEQLQNRATAS